MQVTLWGARRKKVLRRARLSVGKVISHLAHMFCASRFGRLGRAAVYCVLWFELSRCCLRKDVIAMYTWTLLVFECHCYNLWNCRILSALTVLTGDREFTESVVLGSAQPFARNNRDGVGLC